MTTRKPDTRTHERRVSQADMMRLVEECKSSLDVIQDQMREGFEFVNTRVAQVDTVVGKVLSDTVEMKRTLNGNPDRDQRDVEPGLVRQVKELRDVVTPVKAVAKAMWAVIGIIGVGGVTAAVIAIATATR